MSRVQQHPAPPRPAPVSMVENAAVWIVAVLVVVAPVLLGCSGIWTRLLLETAIVVATLAWALSGVRSTWLVLMPVTALALVLLQTIPVPDGLLVRIAPVSAGAWKVAHGGAATSAASISVDPAASATAARRMMLALCALSMVVDLGRRLSYRKRLLVALAASGGAMMLAGAVFGSAKDHRMLGFVNLAGPLEPSVNPTIMPVQTNGVGVRTPITVGSLRYEIDQGYTGDGFGTYIYSNHFGGGVNLTFPLLVSVWLIATRQRLPVWVRWAVAAVAWVATIWLVGAVAQSRAGAGALVLGGLVLTAIAAEARVIRWSATGLVIAYATALAACGLVMLCLLFGPTETILGLLPLSWKPTIVQTIADARIVAAQVALRMTAASPLLGTGLDTYETVFPRFHTSSYTLFFAHNDYAQFLAEGGLIAGLLVLPAAVVLAGRCIRYCVEAKGDYRMLNAGAWAALAGIGLHSALDWNLHLPANALLACTVVGLCASSVPARTWPTIRAVLDRIPAWSAKALLVVACLVSIALLARDAASEAVQRTVQEAVALDRLDPARPEQRLAPAALASSIQAAERMAAWDARDARLLLLLGQANLHLSRHADSAAAQNERIGVADIWFLKARQASASLRGLPGPAPPPSPAPAPAR